MTDYQFKRLSRAQLIEIIYKLQEKQDELTKDNLDLKMALENKRIRISEAGNIANAALEINNCFEAAQKAADQYLNEIKTMRDETKAECQKMLEQAKKQADAILTKVAPEQPENKLSIESILKEFKHNK